MTSENTLTQGASNVEFERLTTLSYTLEVVSGPDRGQRLKTASRVVRIGSNPECELELSDAATSRFHARIEVDGIGHKLVDESSKNGSFINDIRIREAYLTTDCQIRIGDNTLRYETGVEKVEIALSKRNHFGRILGCSASMREIFAMLERVSTTDMTVLVEGESGTGKELVAEGIHQHSKRAKGAFVVFDCSAVAPTLIESELFGHVKGAFTGATSNRAGAFERAHGGTLFLDELGELPLELQPKLLRALEQRMIKAVGSDKEQKVDVRIVAASNRNLGREVEQGQFRQDLFYRLAVIRIVLPPLRRRAEDIPMLVNHFLEEIEAGSSQRIQVGYDTILKLQNHRWPGNIRELRNFVERAALLTSNDRLESYHLSPPSVGDVTSRGAGSTGEPEQFSLAALDEGLPFKDAKSRLVELFERAYWKALLQKTNGNISAASRIAGIHRKSAEYLIKKLDLGRSSH